MYLVYYSVTVGHTTLKQECGRRREQIFKDSAFYCYCAYVLRISRYSGFLWVVPTSTGIFLRGLKLYGESRT